MGLVDAARYPLSKLALRRELQQHNLIVGGLLCMHREAVAVPPESPARNSKIEALRRLYSVQMRRDRATDELVQVMLGQRGCFSLSLPTT